MKAEIEETDSSVHRVVVTDDLGQVSRFPSVRDVGKAIDMAMSATVWDLNFAWSDLAAAQARYSRMLNIHNAVRVLKNQHDAEIV